MPIPYRPAASADWYRMQYDTLGCRGIAKKLEVSRDKVRKDLHRLGIEVRPQRPHAELKRDYFDQINTPTKAYLYGFILADGTLDQRTMQLRIRVADEDRSHLENIRREVSGPMLRTQAPRQGRQQATASLCISSKQVVGALVRLGVVENKDNVLGPFTPVEPHLAEHLVRGLVDGDGCLKLIKNKFPRIEFTNRSTHLRAAVRAHWESLGATVREYVYLGEYPRIYCNSLDSVAVARAMYLANADPDLMALPRKVEIARRFLTYVPSNRPLRSNA